MIPIILGIFIIAAIIIIILSTMKPEVQGPPISPDLAPKSPPQVTSPPSPPPGIGS